MREQVATAIDLVVHQARRPDGSRAVTEVAEVVRTADGADDLRAARRPPAWPGRGCASMSGGGGARVRRRRLRGARRVGRRWPRSTAARRCARSTRWLAPLRAGRDPTPAERRRLALVGAGDARRVRAGSLGGAGPRARARRRSGPPPRGRRSPPRGARRRAELAAAAPAVARALADAIAAGHSVRGAIRGGARGRRGAAADELRAAAALELGEPTAACSKRCAAARTTRPGTRSTAAILLQADAGGDLAGAAARPGRPRSSSSAATRPTRARPPRRPGSPRGSSPRCPLGAAVLAELASPGFLAGLAGEPLTAALAALSLALQLVAIVAIRRIVGASGSGSR